MATYRLTCKRGRGVGLINYFAGGQELENV